MRGNTIIPIIFSALILCSSAAFGAEANPWEFLPTRVLEIEEGAVEFQSAVIVDTRQKLANPLFQNYPTKYILSTTNESDFPIWIEAEWRVPGEKPITSFGTLDPKSHGDFFLKIKRVKWNTPIPVGVTIYADENKSHKLATRDVILQFGEEEKDTFLQSAKQVNSLSEKNAFAFGKKAWMPLLPGFQEMINISKPVPGTAADETLTRDIRLILWKNQSRHHWGCTHEVLGAHQYDPKDSTKVQALHVKDKQLIEEGLARGDITFEEWHIKSCDSVSSYLVLTGKSSNGRTDVMAVEMKENTSP